jgi:DNA protecting protein DprA
METVSAFWAGAIPWSGGVCWTTLAASVGGWAAVADADDAALVAAGATPEAVARWRRASACETLGTAITLADPRYPSGLRATRRPPPVLFVEGAPEALSAPGIAVVGTRDATGYGRAVAHHLGSALAGAGRAVVSGLARGIDAEAHAGAVRSGRTVAVLGSGLGFTAPTSNVGLRRRIVASGGAVVSAWPDGQPPRGWTFPSRNAWIVGLSEAVVVVEAGVRSGALITARLAACEGREVYAVPGPIGATTSDGCLALLEEGASVLRDVPGFVARMCGTPIPTMSELVREVSEGRDVEEVARRLGRSVVDVLVALGRLETQGTLVARQGGRWVPVGWPSSERTLPSPEEGPWPPSRVDPAAGSGSSVSASRAVPRGSSR